MQKPSPKPPLRRLLGETMRFKVHNIHPQSRAEPSLTKFTETVNEDGERRLKHGSGGINKDEIGTGTSSGSPKAASLDTLNETDFNRCRKHLRDVFCRCNRLEFGILSILISGTFTGFRRFDRYEMRSLITLSWNQDTVVGQDFTTVAEAFFDSPRSERARKQSEENRMRLFFIDEDGFLDFSDQCMRQFLGAYPIHGLDLTHRMMANACIRQLEIDNHISHPLFRTCLPEQLPLTSAFSGYANQFWTFHYRLTTPPFPLLSERVHQLIYTSSYRSVECVDGCTWLAPCRDVAEAAIKYCEVNSLQSLIAPYIQISARASVVQLRTDPPDLTTDSQEVSFSMVFSQLELCPTENCPEEHKACSQSPDSMHSSVDQLRPGEQRWILV